ncbi:MAG: hypothetical protein IKP10_00695 [Clostridia bacterium]|nr:hypothetical protein [Clostridia bacterium]
MLKKLLILFMCACMLLAAVPVRGDTLIRWHDAENGQDELIVRENDDIPREGTFAWKMAHTDFISQRDIRLNSPVFHYINDEPFYKSGCGPAALFNGLQAVYGDIPLQGLLEMMKMLAYYHQPAVYPINYNLVVRLADPEIGDYPTLASAFRTVPRMTVLDTVDTDTVTALLKEKTEGATVALGRFSLSRNTQTFVEIAKALCDAGQEDAILCLAAVSAGTVGIRSPFGMGENGHFFTLVVQAGEFCRDGTVYVVDPSPRALQNEKLSDIYRSYYYYVVTTGTSDFRDNYYVRRLRNTVLMCCLDRNIDLTLVSGNTEEQARYLRMITTFGTGTLLIRFGDH